MPGRRHVAGPGEATCPAPGCERPAGFATEHKGEGLCRRHAGTQPSPEPRADPPSPRDAPEGGTAAPPARRLRGDAAPNPDPLAVVRLLLTCARRAGFAFEPAWELASEAALSYMSDHDAEHWWAALTATERAWADAYAREGSRLRELAQD